MPTSHSMLSDQDGFNAETLAIARTFTMTPEQAERIAASAWRECELKIAMQTYIWTETFNRVRAKMGCHLMPRWIENGLCHAWDVHGAEFMAIARAQFEALARKEAA